ncbi:MULTISPECIES: DICT sensory domain-containing protein [unclassified Roseofilum]|uniref:DICT sensory domain-containing protein n=1 Tax=unclassified Roseofilum TaxID=2620099 RepID=UPI001B151000|nr:MULTISPECIES: DICT sensory domain-containing protein [unclassified Roseofilum]MBP0007211.1 GAF domain-containing protein [Roseofilum sp. Belize Diploria]MBP0031854.1 GAF domain-containing protein [Roseofilum sp. Belize BBD 4]
MSNYPSVLADLLQRLPQLRSQIYFKPSLTALSHAMEDQVLAGAGADQPLVIANFQRERFYRQESHRYRRIAQKTDQVYVLAAPETEFKNASQEYETIAFSSQDELKHEWHLVIIGQQYATCLICRERDPSGMGLPEIPLMTMDQARRFEGIWTFDRQICEQAAQALLSRILEYRPELAAKVEQAQTRITQAPACQISHLDPAPFAERLVTYLQAGQYKLVKAYTAIANQEKKERLVNSITDAIRRSLNPEEIFQIAAKELGQAMESCRCLIYPCKASQKQVTIEYEYMNSRKLSSLKGKTWPLTDHPLFSHVIKQNHRAYLSNLNPDALNHPTLTDQVTPAKIHSWLMVPVLYKEELLGMIEIHHCGESSYTWASSQLEMVQAIASQIGVALIQAQAYANLEDLNQQLEALDRTTRNLIAITGHELRTPLSTIQVCLESLASEPDMPQDLRQVMLNTALDDAERLRELIQDFLTLSRLESGSVDWNPEPLPLEECIDLAISSIRSHQPNQDLPQIITHLPRTLPLVHVDGEWLVEVLSKLLDNACKFTPSPGQVTIQAICSTQTQPFQERVPPQKRPQNNQPMILVTVEDSGRGIEPNRLETVFDRFYQEEGALRRSTGGTGLGLAICRQIVTNWGGQIWAESGGKNQGSQFRFTLPIADKGLSQGSSRGSSRGDRPSRSRRQSPTIERHK